MYCSLVNVENNFYFFLNSLILIYDVFIKLDYFYTHTIYSELEEEEEEEEEVLGCWGSVHFFSLHLIMLLNYQDVPSMHVAINFVTAAWLRN